MLASIAFSLALAISADAAAAQAKPAQAPAAAKTSSENQIICKTTGETGSRLSSHRVCHTKAQWDQLSADSSKELQNQQMQAYQGSPH